MADAQEAIMVVAFTSRWLAVGLVGVLAMGCRRDRAVSRLDTLPVLTWAPSPGTEPGPQPAAPAAPPPAAAPAPAPPVAAPAPADPSQPPLDQEEEADAVAATEEEQTEPTGVPEEAQPEEVAISDEEAARLEQIEQENQLLREQLSALQETQQMLAAEIGQLNVELTRLTQLSAIADAYSVEAANLGMLLGTNEPPPEPLQFEPTEATVPPGAEIPAATMFGAVPMTPATPTVTAPSAPTISGPSTPTVRPPALQFGAPPAPAAQPLTAVPPTNFGGTPVPRTTTR